MTFDLLHDIILGANPVIQKLLEFVPQTSLLLLCYCLFCELLPYAMPPDGTLKVVILKPFLARRTPQYLQKMLSVQVSINLVNETDSLFVLFLNQCMRQRYLQHSLFLSCLSINVFVRFARSATLFTMFFRVGRSSWVGFPVL